MASPHVSTGKNYPNPLDNFRSYSYQFILTAASTTQAFVDQIGSPESPSPLLSAVTQATRPGQSFTVGNGKSEVYLLIDTRRFSQYSITELQMSHTYGTGDRANPTTPMATTHMEIIDTTGISFFNMMMDLFRTKLQSSKFSTFFLLSIIFVGHKDDGTTETVSTCYIPMTLVTMGFSFDASGSKYQIEMTEQEGGTSRGGSGSQQMNYLGTVKSVSTKGTDNNLGGMMDSLEDALNAASLKFYQKYANDAVTKTGPDGGPMKLGKLVQYMINIPDDWRKMPISTATRSHNEELMFPAKTKTNTSAPPAANEFNLTKLEASPAYSEMKFSEATTITDAVKSILESSIDFLSLQSEDNKKSGQAIAFKTLMALTSDETTYLIHIDVYPYLVPNVANTPDIGASSLKTGQANIDTANDQSNIIEYNYLFSGLNNAIIDFKIDYMPEAATMALDSSLNIGAPRFAQNAAEGQKKSDVARAASGEKTSATFSPDLRSSDPIFMAVQTKDQKNNNATQKAAEAIPADQAAAVLKAKQEYTKTMADVHFLTTTSVEITVRGNPNIISKYADKNTRGGPIPHDLMIGTSNIAMAVTDGILNTLAGQNKIALKTAKDSYRTKYYQPRIDAVLKPKTTKDPLINNLDVSVAPLFVKINIYAPNMDYEGNAVDASAGMFTDAFFYNGAYRVLFIETHFQGGEFTHDITLVPSLLISSQNDGPSKPVSK